MERNNKIKQLYKELLEKHGKPSKGWSLWCKRPKTLKEKEEVIIGTILTQRTSWKNVELAFAKLKKEKLCSLAALARNPRRIPHCIRSAGFYNQKSEYLLSLARYIVKNGGIKKFREKPLDALRGELLALKGVGPETADSILLYAFEKPVFVIDEYTKKVLTANGLRTTAKGYEELRKLFEDNLPRDWRLYQDFHALVVREGKSNL